MLESNSTARVRGSAIAALLISLTPVLAFGAELDTRELVRRAVDADDRNWRIAQNYQFAERVDARRLDANGRLKSRDVKTFEVLQVDGSPYRRLSGRADLPLPPIDEKRESEKLSRSSEERIKQSAVQRALRRAESSRRPEWQREALQELPDAMDFQLTGVEIQAGRAVYVIEAKPRSGYQPRSRAGKMLLHIQLKLWVDKQDYHLAKAELEALDTLSIGIFLVRVAKGARAVILQTRVDDGEVWLPQRVHALASVRLGLLSVVHIDQEITYTGRRQATVNGSPITTAARHLMVK